MSCTCRSATWPELAGETPDIILVNPATGCAVSIDACIAVVITYLWSAGIRTDGCCCGHNRRRPCVGIIPDIDDARRQLVRSVIAQVDGREWEIT